MNELNSKCSVSQSSGADLYMFEFGGQVVESAESGADKDDDTLGVGSRGEAPVGIQGAKPSSGV